MDPHSHGHSHSHSHSHTGAEPGVAAVAASPAELNLSYHAMERLTVGIIVVSDRVSRGEMADLGGPALKNFCTGTLMVPERNLSFATVPDEIDAIQGAIKTFVQAGKSLVLTTGGTGFAPRDVTPEATLPLLERQAPGLVVAMLSAGIAITPLAALSRPAAGICGKTLIVNLPGSPKGAVENLTAIAAVIPHAVRQIEGVPRQADPHSTQRT
eukprot:comp12749_c0_seq1/m.17007 comp12749_c0_seq1/g.17007  ORF comp12749_c0_seq1/g.17007 comp12749_c0_seq1/m.17007 type:complete len:212 (+) comp12749_c0_seq1:40-675(+)